jgi:protein-S-isoprenylcysteine O-methyltransferase Ste14
MRKYRLLTGSFAGVGFVITLVLMLLAPKIVVMHFAGGGIADSWGGRAGLFLEPVLLLIIAFFCDHAAVRERKREDLSDFTQLLPSEWRYVGMLLLCTVGFTVLQMYQIGWLH